MVVFAAAKTTILLPIDAFKDEMVRFNVRNNPIPAFRRKVLAIRLQNHSSFSLNQHEVPVAARSEPGSHIKISWWFD